MIDSGNIGSHQRMFARLLLATTLALLIVGPISAQVLTVTITGAVFDAETGDPLPGANVFIASSMMGTITDGDGRFTLQRVPVGALRLYASSLGYEAEAKDVFLRAGSDRNFEFRLKPTVLELEGVVVEAEHDKKWKGRLEKFTRMFIGETPNAAETTIMNPEVLDFTDKKGVFRAYAQEPLEFENRALGYRVTYFLKDFEATSSRVKYDGEPLFEELEPTNDEERNRWRQNRDKAFIGSFRHFMLALLAHKVQEQGFEVFGRMIKEGPLGSAPELGSRHPIEVYSIIRDGESADEKVLDFEAAVEIRFTGEYEDPSYNDWVGSPGIGGRNQFQTSWIRLEKGPTIVDYKGDVLDPYGVTFMGYLAFERVADQVPKEYRPGR
ncbi:MAG: carboxypeptidase-like regulatory domain-containing protein [Rhodothermales bacterium]